MYFTIEALGRCSSELEYGYFNTFEEITESSSTSYSVPYKSSSSSSTNGRVTSSTLYFTLKKDSKEYNGSMGIIFYYKLIVLVLILKILKKMIQIILQL